MRDPYSLLLASSPVHSNRITLDATAMGIAAAVAAIEHQKMQKEQSRRLCSDGNGGRGCRDTRLILLLLLTEAEIEQGYILQWANAR